MIINSKLIVKSTITSNYGVKQSVLCKTDFKIASSYDKMATVERAGVHKPVTSNYLRIFADFASLLQLDRSNMSNNV